MEWLHYSDDDSLSEGKLAEMTAREQDHFKPVGFWLSHGDAWKQYSEGTSIGCGEYVYRVRLNRGIRAINITTKNLAAFSEEFALNRDYITDNILRFVDWNKVKLAYQVITFYPYRRSRNCYDIWYNSVSIPSACVLDSTAIACLDRLVVQ